LGKGEIGRGYFMLLHRKDQSIPKALRFCEIWEKRGYEKWSF
jgi:hypothetical protein